MIEINLVPDVKQELIKAQRVRSTVVTVSFLIGIASIAVIAMLAIYVFAVQSVRGGIDDAAIKSESDKLASVQDLSKTLTIQNQLTKISMLNSQKNIDSRIFDVLGAVIPPSPNNIQISNLRLDSEEGLITIEGQAPSGLYDTVETFKKTVEGAQVIYKDSDGKSQKVDLTTDVQISNTSLGEDSSGARVLRFTITFDYAPELFAPDSESVKIVITTDGNVTDSYLGLPKSIFADRATDLQGGN